MLVFGKVHSLNYDDYTVTLELMEYDGFITPPLYVPMLFTGANKSSYMPDLDTITAAFMNEEMTEGVIIGSVYNDEDIVLTEYKGKEYVKFADGVTVCHAPNSNTIEITAENVIINGNIVCSGNITNSGDITSEGDVSDKKGSMQDIRDWANEHVHSNGNLGSNTGVPVTGI